jgi:hypothetical protein
MHTRFSGAILGFMGYQPGAGAQVLSYGQESTGITRHRQNWSLAGDQPLPPYSITALILHPAR